MMHRKRFLGSSLGCAGFACLFWGAQVAAAPITLQNATATFSQAGFTANETIDNIFVGTNGWAIDPQEGRAQVIVWETVADLSSGGLTLTMSQLFGGRHLIGRFKFSVTTDDRSLFADGLATGGDVSANWIALTNPLVSSSPLMSFSTALDGTVLVTSAPPTTAVYTINFNVPLSGVTGIRMDVLTDPSLPRSGPGMQPTNGNFVLTEIGAESIPANIPEPAPLSLLGLGLAGLAYGRQRSKR